MSFIKYDSSSMILPGLSRDLKSLGSRLVKAKSSILEMSNTGEQGWFTLPYDVEMRKRIVDLAASKNDSKPVSLLVSVVLISRLARWRNL